VSLAAPFGELRAARVGPDHRVSLSLEEDTGELVIVDTDRRSRVYRTRSHRLVARSPLHAHLTPRHYGPEHRDRRCRPAPRCQGLVGTFLRVVR